MKHRLLFFMLSLLAVFNQAAATDYTLVKGSGSAPEIGQEYIIAIPEYKVAMGGVYTSVTNNRAAVAVTVTNETITLEATSTVTPVTFEESGNTSFPYLLKIVGTNNYLYNPTTSKNQISTTSDATNETAFCKVDIDVTGAATIAFNNKTYMLQGYYNTTTKVLERFSCFTASHKKPSLYKKNAEGDPSLLPAGLSFDKAAYRAIIGEDFESPVLTNPNNLTVAWSSSEPTVATVDGNGIVTVLSKGTTTIEATSEATDVYNAGNATYTLTVTGVPYTLATKLTDLYDGAIAVIGGQNESAKTDHLMGAKNSTYREKVDYTDGFSDGVIDPSAVDGVAYIKFHACETPNTYKLEDTGATGEDIYLTSSTAKNLTLSNSGTEVKLTFSDKGVPTLDFNGNPLKYNPGTPRFTTYASGQNDIKIFVAPRTPVEVTPTLGKTEFEEEEMWDVTFVPADFPDCVTNLQATSSNEDVIVLDHNGDGTWQIVAGEQGTATITLTWEEGTGYLAGTTTIPVTVTDPRFKYAQEEYTFMMGTMPEALPAPTGSTEYTLTSSNPDVVRVSLTNPQQLWLMAPGTATVTAHDPASDQTATITLNVTEESPFETVIFDFTKNAYGMTVRNSSNDSGGYEAENTVVTNGPVSMKINEKEGARMWINGEDQDFRLYGNKSLTFTATGNVTKVECPGVQSSKLESTNEKGAVTIKNTSSSKVDIKTISVTFERPAHKPSYMELKGECVRIYKDEYCTVGGAFQHHYTKDVPVGYIILDKDGKEAENLEYEVTDDGKLGVVSEDEPGTEYTLIAYVEPDDTYYPAYSETKLVVEDAAAIHQPQQLYMYGYINHRYFDHSDRIELKATPAENGGEPTVFATEQAVFIGWNPETVKEEERSTPFHVMFYAPAETSAVLPARVAPLDSELTSATTWADYTEGNLLDANGWHPAEKIDSQDQLSPHALLHGAYDVTVDLTDKFAPVTTFNYNAEATNAVTGVDNIRVDNTTAAPAAADGYYDMMGRRVTAPAAGNLYIHISAGRATKVIL